MQPFILKDLRIALLSWEETYSETWCDQIALSLPQRFSASGSCWYSELKECFSVLISFMLMFPFYILWKHQKTKCWYSQMLWNMNIGNKMLIFFCLQYHIPIDKWIFRSNHPEVFCKKVFLEISQNSQGSTSARLKACNFIKKRLWHRCFPVNFAKFLGTPTFPVAASLIITNIISFF